MATELAFLRIGAVSEITGLAISTINTRVRAGTFPEPYSIGPRAVAWRSDEIHAWVEARPRVSEIDDAWREKQADVMAHARAAKRAATNDSDGAPPVQPRRRRARASA